MSHTGLFQLDPDAHRPTKVAGVPLDYFSADGQLWGNPSYDWAAMKQDGYRWWVDRIGAALTIRPGTDRPFPGAGLLTGRCRPLRSPEEGRGSRVGQALSGSPW